jgi:hypothetical protein
MIRGCTPPALRMSGSRPAKKAALARSSFAMAFGVGAQHAAPHLGNLVASCHRIAASCLSQSRKHQQFTFGGSPGLSVRGEGPSRPADRPSQHKRALALALSLSEPPNPASSIAGRTTRDLVPFYAGATGWSGFTRSHDRDPTTDNPAATRKDVVQPRCRAT